VQVWIIARHDSRAQSADSSKACSKPRDFNCYQFKKFHFIVDQFTLWFVCYCTLAENTWMPQNKDLFRKVHKCWNNTTEHFTFRETWRHSGSIVCPHGVYLGQCLSKRFRVFNFVMYWTDDSFLYYQKLNQNISSDHFLLLSVIRDARYKVKEYCCCMSAE